MRNHTMRHQGATAVGRRRRRLRFAALGIASVATLLLTATACGDDDGDVSSEPTTESSESSASTTSSAQSAPPVSLEGRVNDRGSVELGSETALELELGESYFAPTFVEGEPGSMVTVTLTNEGNAPHTFTIDDANIDEELEPGATATVVVELPDDGSVVYYCRFHVGAGMQGAFVVSDASPTPAGSSSGGMAGY